MKKFIVCLPLIAMCIYTINTIGVRPILGLIIEGPAAYSFYRSIPMTKEFCNELMAGEQKPAGIDTHEKCVTAFRPVILGMIVRN